MLKLAAILPYLKTFSMIGINDLSLSYSTLLSLELYELRFGYLRAPLHQIAGHIKGDWKTWERQMG